MKLTYAVARKIFKKAKAAELRDFVADFNRFQWLHKMTDLNEICNFLGQIAHETLELTYREEIASGEAYEKRADLGNTEAGDGKKYKGRAWLMLTGKWNYKDFTRWYNLLFKDKEDFTTNPERIAQEHELCFIASVYFWRSKKIKPLAIQNDIDAVTYKINGGYTHLAERKRYTLLAYNVLSKQVS